MKNIELVKVHVVVIIIAFIICVPVGFHIMTKSVNKTINQYKSENASLLEDNRNLKKTITESITNYNVCENEMIILSKRLDGIKDSNDLLKRDIFLYIDKKFQLIPKTVAMEIADQIIINSKKENVSAELIVGMIQVESTFNPMAISKKNARGLMQVMPEWKKKFGLKKVTDLHDISTNIQCGIKVLKIHIKEGHGSISKELYYYVGKSDSYASKVYEAMGRFVAFRSTLDDDDDDDAVTGKTEDEGGVYIK